MTTPTITVEVAFATDPLATTPTWTDITTYVEAIGVSYGRQQEADIFQPGTMTLTLDNSDRRFDPLHATGPYYGDLTPNKRVRFTVNWSATDYDQFYGFVDTWPQSKFEHPGVAVAVVPATDAFKLLAADDVPESVWAMEVASDSPEAWWKFAESEGDRIYDSAGNDHTGSLPADISELAVDGIIAGSPDGGLRFPPVYNTVQAFVPSSAMPDSTAFTVEFWMQVPTFDNRPDFIFTAVDASIWILTDNGSLIGAGSGVLRFVHGAGVDAFTDSAIPFNTPLHVACVRDGSTLYIYLNGVDATGTRRGTPSGNPVPIDASYGGSAMSSSTFDDLVIYRSALSATQVAAHHTAGKLAWDGDDTGERIANLLDAASWPSNQRNIDTGQTSTILGPAVLGAGKVLDYCQTVAVTEQGWFYVDHRDGGKVTLLQRQALLTDTRHVTSQATFTDDPAGTLRYEDLTLTYDDSLIRNDVSVTWTGGTVNVIDQASIDAYTRRSYSVTTINRSELAARAHAEHILASYKDPKVRVTAMRLNPAGDDRLWPEIVARRVGDRVTVVRFPQEVGVAISEELWIDGISHQIGDGLNEWETTFTLAGTVDDTFWRWGDDLWDDDTLWAP